MTAPRARSNRAQKAGPVEITRLGINSLDPDVRAEVLRQAHGDVSRITVINEFEAVVR